MSEKLPDSGEKADRYFHRIDERGNLEKIDILTGDIVSVAPQFEQSLIANRPLNPEFIHGNSKTWHYNELYRDLICNRIANGDTLKQVAASKGFPSISIIYRWRQEHPEFDDALKLAKKARAERYADRLAETLEETRDLDKEQIPAEKLFADKLKWLAEKDDPDTYGSRIKHSGDADQPLTLVVDTGIKRSLEPEPRTEDRDSIEAEYTEIEEDE